MALAINHGIFFEREVVSSISLAYFGLAALSYFPVAKIAGMHTILAFPAFHSQGFSPWCTQGSSEEIKTATLLLEAAQFSGKACKWIPSDGLPIPKHSEAVSQSSPSSLNNVVLKILEFFHFWVSRI